MHRMLRHFSMSRREWKRCQCAFKILVQQSVKSMSWTMPVENFPWPIIEHRLHAFDLAPRHIGKARAGRKQLAQEPVGVLVRPALPWTWRMSKVHFHLGLLREQTMLPHLLPLVVRQRAAQLRGQRPHFAGEGAPHSRGVFGLQRHQQGESGGAFHQCPQRRLKEKVSGTIS
jgi:hypothetical protein